MNTEKCYASIFIELDNGKVSIKHGTDGTVLLEPVTIINGAWVKIVDVIKTEITSFRWDTKEECQNFIIKGMIDPIDGQLYWSNIDGWVDKQSATHFNITEFNEIDFPNGNTGYEEI